MYMRQYRTGPHSIRLTHTHLQENPVVSRLNRSRTGVFLLLRLPSFIAQHTLLEEGTHAISRHLGVSQSV